MSGWFSMEWKRDEANQPVGVGVVTQSQRGTSSTPHPICYSTLRCTLALLEFYKHTQSKLLWWHHQALSVTRLISGSHTPIYTRHQPLRKVRCARVSIQVAVIVTSAIAKHCCGYDTFCSRISIIWVELSPHVMIWSQCVLWNMYK